MPRLLAENLLLLCWDPEMGKVHSACSTGLSPGVGGALVLDAVQQDALQVHDGRAQPTGAPVHDPLIDEVVSAASRRRAPTVKALVRRIGTTRRRGQVRDRLVEEGTLVWERRRILGIVSMTRYPAGELAEFPGTRATGRSVRSR